MSKFAWLGLFFMIYGMLGVFSGRLTAVIPFICGLVILNNEMMDR